MPLSAVTPRRVRSGLGTLLLAVMLLLPFTSKAEGEDPAVIARITNLNKKALDAYGNLEFEDARKLLKQALELCSKSGLDKHPIKARTHIHMGVALIAAKQSDLGVKQFRRAMEIQPDIQLTRTLANPEIVQAFDEAASSVRAMGGGAGEEATGSPPEAVPGTATGGGAPSSQASGDIVLAPVTRGARGRPVMVSASVGPDLKAYTKLVLAYRAQGGAEFTGVDMRRSGSVFVAEIPADATRGSLVHYFVQAENDKEDPVAASGSEGRPYAVTLFRDGAAGGGASGAGGGSEDGEDADRARPRFFFGLGAGPGFGYASGSGELNVAYQASPHIAPASAFQVVPEVGYFLLPQFRLSVQVRLQIVTGRTPLNLMAAVNNNTVPMAAIDSCGTDRICSTGSALAPSVFVRGSWFFRPSSRLQPYFTLAAGAGVIRHLVKFTSPNTAPICGARGDQPCVDSIVAGPIFAGPGGGIRFGLTQAFGLIAEANSVIGLPKFTFHIDLNAGVAAQF